MEGEIEMDIYLILAGYIFCRAIECFEKKCTAAGIFMALWSLVTLAVYAFSVFNHA